MRACFAKVRGLADGPDDNPLQEITTARLHLEQLSAVRRHTPGMMLANLCNAFVVVVALWSSPQQMLAIVWGGALLAVAAFIYFGRHLRPRTDVRSPKRYGRTLLRAKLNALMLGACWAALPLFCFANASPGERLLIACVSAGMMCGGAFGLASIPLAALAFSGPIILASFVALAGAGDNELLLVAILLGVYAVVLLRGVFSFSEQLKTRLLKQIATEQSVQSDALTGLPNRLGFLETIEKAFERTARSGQRFALFCVDLDNFKTINDRFGHLAGDEVLVHAARRIRDALPESDYVARLGGDEFVILATSAQEDADILALAQKVMDCFDEPVLVDGEEISSAASIGVAIAPQHGSELRTLQRNADIALYRAKARVGAPSLFEPRHDAEARDARALELDLLRAVQMRRLSLVFQPVLNIARGDIVGCEALARWSHPTRGPISPAVFIPLAEKTGVIHELGLWVVEEACRAAARFPADFRVAVNVSPIQLRDPEFPDKVLRCLSEANVLPGRLDLEITETTLLSDDQVSIASVKKLAQAGVSIALDDFGTGFSSLSYIRRMPLDRIKIDRSFVSDILAHADCAAIVLGVIRMARDLGITIVAEGVETIEQLNWLRANGCAEAQGYLISRPQPEAEFFSLLSAWRPEKIAA